jgi:adenosylhomocysteine nucleosidase
MYDLIVFAALGWERRAVTEALTLSVPVGGPGRWQGRLQDGGSVIVVQTGVGLERARVAAASAPPARRFLACGCAGALAPWLQPGDLVAAERVVAVDAAGRTTERLPAASAEVAAWAASRGLRLHAGELVSSPCVLTDPVAKAAAGAGGALAVEMESAAIAREAVARGIPFVGLRVVLDVAGQALPTVDGVVNEATGEIRAGRALLALAARPWIWAGTGRLARQQRTAARSLGALMQALLGASAVSPFAEPPAAAKARSG